MREANRDYWREELPVPYAPSLDDIAIYEGYLNGTVLLLGCTHKLLGYADRIIDIDPWLIDDRVKVQDWRDNQEFYDSIIGDGVLNFTAELANAVVDMASQYSRRLIVRSFSHKLEAMIIANYFPGAADFTILPDVVIDFTDYRFFVWEFRS